MNLAIDPRPGLRRSDIFGPPVPPDDVLEEKIAGLWEEVLGVSPIGVEDDYFELGGDSFAAVEIFEALDQRHAISLPISVLIKHRTVRDLARAIRADATDSEDDDIAALREGGAKSPLFLIRMQTIEALTARYVARELADDRPIYLLQLSPDTDPAVSEETIGRLAEICAGRIRAERPEGPYVISGFCLGSLIALETARRLRADGADVAEVIMIDVPRPGSIGLGRRVAHHLREAAAMHPAEAFAYLAARARGLRRRLMPPPTSFRDPRATREIRGDFQTEAGANRDYLLAATARFRPRPYDGDVSLLTSGHFVRMTGDETIGWRPILKGNLRAVQVTDDHGGFFSAGNAALLTPALDAILSDLS